MTSAYTDYRLTDAIDDNGDQQVIVLEEWYPVDTPRKELKEFDRRSDARALRRLGQQHESWQHAHDQAGVVASNITGGEVAALPDPAVRLTSLRKKTQ